MWITTQWPSDWRLIRQIFSRSNRKHCVSKPVTNGENQQFWKWRSVFFVNRDKCFMPLSGLMIKLSNAILNIRMHRCRALSSTLLKHNVIITIDYIDQISKLLPVISCSTKKLSSQIKLRCANYESKWLLWNNLLPVRTVNRKRRKEMFHLRAIRKPGNEKTQMASRKLLARNDFCYKMNIWESKFSLIFFFHKILFL